jgi:hypothetical protein
MRRYRLIFEGHIQSGQSRDQVQRRLADLFQVSPEEIETLFSRAPVVLKEDLDYDRALADKADFDATGAVCRLEAQPLAAASGAKEDARQDAALSGAPGHASPGRRYGLWQAPLLALYSRSFYRDVAAHWRGLAFVHLLLVMLLSAFVYTLHFRGLLARFIAEEAPAIVEQVPEIMIADGRVRVDVAEPYTIRWPQGGAPLAVIDTTGEITSLAQTDAALLLTADRLAARLSEGESRVLDLRTIESLRVDRNVVQQWLLNFLHWAPFILFPTALGIAFVLRSAQALLYAGIGLALSALYKIALPYGALVSVAIMAMTPFLLIDALLVWFDAALPLWGLIGFIMAMGYLVFGIRAAAPPA